MRRSRLGFARANSLRPAPLIQLFFAGTLAFGAGTYGHDLSKARGNVNSAVNTAVNTVVTAVPAVIQQTVQNVSDSKPAQAIVNAGASFAAAVEANRSENVSRETELDEGQTFADLLSEAGASQAESLAAMNALAKVYDMHHLRAGQDVTLYFSRSTQQEIFNSAVFEPEATKEVTIARNSSGGFTATIAQIQVVRQRLAARAEINTSLRDAAEKAGIPHAIIASLIRVYSHEIDFQRDIHPGDRFEVLYDQPTTKNGKPVGEGSIIYATMEVGGKAKPVYRVTFSDNTVDYFDGSGKSVRRTLLRTPVAAAHITSGFGMRMHPILGYSKMHKGVDFGATTGTPIFAAGSGVIEEIGFKGGYGRYVRIRHNNQLETAYAHMSRFSTNLYRGARVSQGQVIGYVGMSGRATGPHLHFETLVNNQQVNPMSVNLPTGRILEGKLLAEFKQGEGRVQQEFQSLLSKNASAHHASGFVRTSSSEVAFPTKKQTSCGSKSGC
ncbi:MAG: M23 family metallopeptidase [Pseudomonadota bacterium]|nr:M23 family metallopeptidase [Pseudomonadota bacterium]